MSIDGSKANDNVVASAGRVRDGEDGGRATGFVTWELRGPDGELKASGEEHNIITDTGSRMYWERGAGVTGAPAAPTGMKLGIGTTAAAKNGAGAALVTYVTNSHQAFDNVPTSQVNGANRQVTYKCTFAAGKATSATAIAEAVIVIDALADATSTAANTAHRVLLSSPAAKAAADTLTVTWTCDLTY